LKYFKGLRKGAGEILPLMRNGYFEAVPHLFCLLGKKLSVISTACGEFLNTTHVSHAAANAHDRHPDFIMKRWITFHLQRAVRRLTDI
jgi:hypothetical protein